MRKLPLCYNSQFAFAGLLLLVASIASCPTTPACAEDASPEKETAAGSAAAGVTDMSQPKPRVLHADRTSFASLVLESERPVLVDFYADWCGPCRRLAPVLEELAEEVPEALIVKVNVDRSPSLMSEYGVQAIPSIRVFHRGKLVHARAGLASKRELRALLVR